MSIGPYSTPTTVFTAIYPGIQHFVLKLSDSGTGLVQFGGQTIVSAYGSGVQGSGSVYLEHDDVVTYQGPEAELFGVRLGNEL